MIAILACLSAALAIGAGAFGAHGVADPKAAEWLRTGGLYQLVHAVAALAVVGTARGAAALMLAGATIFAVSLSSRFADFRISRISLKKKPRSSTCLFHKS